MPVTPNPEKTPRYSSSQFPFLKTATMPRGFDPDLAGQAIVDGLVYLKNRLEWSGSKIAHILHLPPTTINTWLKNGYVPLHDVILTPDIQTVIHLLAIHRSLEIMFSDSTHQQAWLTTNHSILATAPETMMSRSVDGLILVRQYLEHYIDQTQLPW